MAEPKKRKTRFAAAKEQDSTYILKLVLYLVVGSFWVRIMIGDNFQIPIPVGAIIGIMFATREKFQIDRKIEYALLLVSMFIGFWLPLGLVLAF